MSDIRNPLWLVAKALSSLVSPARLRLRDGEQLWDEWADYGARRPPAPRRRPRRLAAASSLLAGVTLVAALSAGATVTVASMVEDGETAASPTPDGATTPVDVDAPASGSTTAPPATPTGADPGAEVPPPATEQPEPEAAAPEGISLGTSRPSTAPVDETGDATPASTATAPPAAPVDEIAARPKPGARATQKQQRPARRAPKVRRPRPKLVRKLDPEAEAPGTRATIWLHRTLPDPTPPSKRLSRAFARSLVATSKETRVPWSQLLAVLRARGESGSTPASPQRLSELARELGTLGVRRDEWGAFRSLADGDEEFADRAQALAFYNRAVGLRALVRGLSWAKPRLAARVLRDDRIATYSGGRADIEADRIDVRVLTLLLYLAEIYDDVTVSCLESGHGLYSRPGVISAHIYGLAVDISGLGGKSIMGNSEPGGLTEHAVRDVLLLPAELQPRQVISLLGLGGPSFPLGNHDDHIHVGY